METLVVGVLGVLAALAAAWIGYRAAHQTADKEITQLTEQLKTARRQLDVDAVGMTSHELTAIDEVLIEYPKLRPCFYDGVDPNELTDLTDDKERIKAVAARLVNGYATILLQSRKEDEKNPIPAAWARATVAGRYGNSPACCDHLMAYIEEYGYTGKLQIQLMIDGLTRSQEAASEQNDTGKVERLTARIAVVETAKEGLFKRIDQSNAKYAGSALQV
jgi:hypothetical protein